MTRLSFSSRIILLFFKYFLAGKLISFYGMAGLEISIGMDRSREGSFFLISIVARDMW